MCAKQRWNEAPNFSHSFLGWAYGYNKFGALVYRQIIVI